MALITPVGDNVLAKVIPGVTQIGSILLSPNAQKPVSQQAIVVATGTGKYRKSGQFIPIEVNVGDRILYKKYGMRELNIDGEFYVMVGSDDIIAVME